MDSQKDLLQRIEKALDTIRPFLKNDGGDVKIVEVTPDLVVKVVLLGACGNCPFNMMTLENGIVSAIKREVPEITGVLATQEDKNSEQTR